VPRIADTEGPPIVSVHYEWVLSLRLRPDVPEPVLAELRFHAGLAGERPAMHELGYDFPVFTLVTDDALRGGAVTTLKFQQPYLNRLDHGGCTYGRSR
jgi:hypothetical protein